MLKTWRITYTTSHENCPRCDEAANRAGEDAQIHPDGTATETLNYADGPHTATATYTRQ